MEISFTELRSKTVVNLTDGRRLGHIIDVIFEQTSAKVLGVVVPGTKSGVFKSREDIFIPYQCICKIGLDTILVQLNPVSQTVSASKYIDNYAKNSIVVEPNNKMQHYTTYANNPDRN